MRLVKTKLGKADFWYREDDKFIGQKVAEGKYEEYETKLLLSQIDPKNVVIDVGANIGYYTLLMAQKAGKVYAFEPEKETFEILKKNVEENKLKNVVLFNMAVGSRNEKVGITKNKDNYGDSRITPGDTTDCVKLDEVIKEKVDLIKIDTQGWEPAVILGAKKIISKDSPILFLEYWPEGVAGTKYDLGSMIYELKKTYKYIWQIDTNLNIYKKFKNQVDEKTGYADLWMKNKIGYYDWVWLFKNLSYKKIIKGIMGYGKNK